MKRRSGSPARAQPLRIATLMLGAALLLAAAAPGAGPYLDPEGRPLPFEAVEEVLDFLSNAEPVSWERLEEGTNKRKRSLVLSRGGLTARAIFRYGYEIKEGGTGGFVDSYQSELAAFELSRMLGLEAVPPVVPRKMMGKRGALQIWIEKAMTDADRRRKGIEPPDPEAFERQLRNMHVFDNLIANSDRNPGNILIDSDWKVWYIDQTRSFSGHKTLRYPGRISGCDRALWRRLQELRDGQIEEALRRYTGKFTWALLERRRKLIDELGRRIREQGEEGFLFSAENP